MPNGDKTGPAGLGPMTGRKLGYCVGAAAPGGAGRGWGPGGGQGRRRGFGRGRGWCRGPGGRFPWERDAAPREDLEVRLARLELELAQTRRALGQRNPEPGKKDA